MEGGGYADVWKGVYKGRQVAIKALRVYETSDLEKTGRVSHPYLFPNRQTSANPREHLF